MNLKTNDLIYTLLHYEVKESKNRLQNNSNAKDKTQQKLPSSKAHDFWTYFMRIIYKILRDNTQNFMRITYKYMRKN